MSYEVEGDGDYYLIPRKSGQEAIIDPYLYEVQGVETLLTSLVVPIMVKGQFYGIAGVDIGLEFLQEFTDTANVFGGAGQMILISNGGYVAGLTGSPDVVGSHLMDISDDWEDSLNHVQQAEEYIEKTDGNLIGYAPIFVGKADTAWSTLIYVPLSTVTQAATRQLTTTIIISVALILLGAVALWMIGKQIVAPPEDHRAGGQAARSGR